MEGWRGGQGQLNRGWPRVAAAAVVSAAAISGPAATEGAVAADASVAVAAAAAAALAELAGQSYVGDVTAAVAAAAAAATAVVYSEGRRHPCRRGRGRGRGQLNRERPGHLTVKNGGLRPTQYGVGWQRMPLQRRRCTCLPVSFHLITCS